MSILRVLRSDPGCASRSLLVASRPPFRDTPILIDQVPLNATKKRLHCCRRVTDCAGLPASRQVFFRAHIFLSYAREDEARAATLVRALTEHGWSVFWDRRIPAGRTWDDILDREVNFNQTEAPLAFRFLESAQLHAWTGTANHPELSVLFEGIAQHVPPESREPSPPPPSMPVAPHAPVFQRPPTSSVAVELAGRDSEPRIERARLVPGAMR